MEEAIQRYLAQHGYTRWQPRVALFDMDGVLYDSMRNHARAWHESMASFGIDMAPEEAYTFEGMRGVETIKVVARRQWGREITDEEAAEMYSVKSGYYADCPMAEQIPGIYQLQQTMHRQGLRIGVVTGSAQQTLLDRILHDFEGLVSPDILVTARDIKHGKPAPDPYLRGMALAGTEPWQTIVVENAPLGVRSAVAAGCFTVAVNTGPLPDSDLLGEGANLLFHTMNEFAEVLPQLYTIHP